MRRSRLFAEAAIPVFSKLKSTREPTDIEPAHKGPCRLDANAQIACVGKHENCWHTILPHLLYDGEQAPA
ncbi:hypothetical protein GJ496_004877 [Pomphorhynchus laevis]|nr:hypothetical protein GJ496_004877 [Pomphorhynchus laevis]